MTSTGPTGAQWLNMFINVLLPILVALVTQRFASGAVKSVTLLFLSALSGYLISWLDALNGVGTFDFGQATWTAVTGFIVAVAAHFGLLKPLDLTGSTGAIARVIPGGFGTPVPHRHAAVADAGSRRDASAA